MKEMVGMAKELFPAGNAQFIVDEAHSTGILGENGRGLVCALGLEKEISQVLPIELSLPAVGQGVLAIQCRAEDAQVRGLLAILEDSTTRVAVTAERALMARLEGGCTVPLAGHARVEGNIVRLRGLVGRPDGSKVVEGERIGPVETALAVGEALAEELLTRGAAEILRDFGHATPVSEP